MSNILSRLKDAFHRGMQANYQDMIFRHKLRVIYRIILCLVLAAAIAIVVRLHIENKVYTQVEILETMERVGTQTSEYKSYNGNVLVYSKDGISAYTDKGEQLFNQTFEMQSPLVSVKGDYVAVGDYKGNVIYVLDQTGPKGQIQTNMMIQSLDISEGGVVTAILDDGDVTWLNIYSQTGEIITTMRTTMKQTGYPLAYELSPDNIKLAVSYLNGQSGQINTSIAFYNFGDVGQNEIGRLVSAESFGEEIIPFVAYPSADTAVALGNANLYFFKGRQIPKLSAKVEVLQEVKGVYYGPGQVVLIFHNTDSEEKYRLVSYDLAGKERINRTFDIEYNNILVQNEMIMIYNDTDVLILNKRGEEKYHGGVGVAGSLLALIPGSARGKFLVVTSESMKQIQLK